MCLFFFLFFLGEPWETRSARSLLIHSSWSKRTILRSEPEMWCHGVSKFRPPGYHIPSSPDEFPRGPFCLIWICHELRVSLQLGYSARALWKQGQQSWSPVKEKQKGPKWAMFNPSLVILEQPFRLAFGLSFWDVWRRCAFLFDRSGLLMKKAAGHGPCPSLQPGVSQNGFRTSM